MADVVMPRLSDTMEEGTILRWLKRDGEHVRRGEELVEIETDKANMTYESDLEGIVRLLAAEGDTLAVGQVIAHVGPASEIAAAQAGGSAGGEGSMPDPPAAGAPDGRAVADGAAVAPGSVPAGVDGARLARGTDRPASGAAGGEPGEGERVKASPLARRIARESGVDLHALTGSGPGGRIVKADVERSPGAPTPATGAPVASAAAAVPSAAAAPSGPAAPAAAGAPAGAGDLVDVMTAKGETTVVERSRLQQAVARRMAESKATIPDFSVQIDVDMDACVALREELKRLSQTQAAGAVAHETPTYNDMVVKACALALREHPHANGSYRDGALQLHSRVNVGVAVAADGALVVPSVFDADSKALGEIARETRLLAERVRAGTITPPELGGGTFTVSNLGMFGVRSFAAIINPPQAAIMSVGALEQRAVVRDGGLAIGSTMALTLVCDHRILYGAEAALFLARVRELLQAPAALTL